MISRPGPGEAGKGIGGRVCKGRGSAGREVKERQRGGRERKERGRGEKGRGGEMEEGWGFESGTSYV